MRIPIRTIAPVGTDYSVPIQPTGENMKPTVIAARAFRALADINSIDARLNDQYNSNFGKVIDQYPLAVAIEDLSSEWLAARRYTLSIAQACARGDISERTQVSLDIVEQCRIRAIEILASL